MVVVGVSVSAFLFGPVKTISGQVIDASSGQPLVGAVIEVGGRQVPVAADGSFSVQGLRFGTRVVADAKGYQPESAMVALDDQLRLTLSPRVLEGTVFDGASRKPLSGVQVVAGGLAVNSDGQGKFRMTGIEPGTEIVIKVEGYAPFGWKYDGQATPDLALKPNVLTLKVLEKSTGKPLEGVEISDGQNSAKTDRQGHAQLQYLKEGAQVDVKAQGYAGTKVTFSGQENAEVQLRSDTVTGTVKDANGQALAGVTVSDGNASVTTDAQGNFKISGLADGAKLAVSGNGYTRQTVDVVDQTNVQVTLKPFVAKGLYLTYYGVGNDDLRDHVLQLADQTEINTVVIDIKGDRGWLAYKSDVPMVQEVGAQQEIQIKDPKQFLADLKKRGVYSIARIVVFKDNPLATARPDLAVINSQTGQPWVDNEGLLWADPTRTEVWDYNIALAVEAIQNGFDEVQFDYVRFPTDASAGNSLDTVSFSQENVMANRVAAINGFLERAKQAIHTAGGNISADIFGYVVWRSDDMGIGQHLEDVAQHVDYVSPMVYPNLFWDGIELNGEVKYGNQQAGLYPYEIVSETMQVAVRRIGAEKLRPWLEYYNDYLTGKSYTAYDMELQKKATYESGVTGWLFWDPSNSFGKGGFEPKQ